MKRSPNSPHLFIFSNIGYRGLLDLQCDDGSIIVIINRLPSVSLYCNQQRDKQNHYLLFYIKMVLGHCPPSPLTIIVIITCLPLLGVIMIIININNMNTNNLTKCSLKTQV